MKSNLHRPANLHDLLCLSKIKFAMDWLVTVKIFISSVGRRVVIKLYLLRLEVIPTVDELKLSLIISFYSGLWFSITIICCAYLGIPISGNWSWPLLLFRFKLRPSCCPRLLDLCRRLFNIGTFYTNLLFPLFGGILVGDFKFTF